MFEVVNVPILGIIENMSGFTCSHCHETTHIFAHGGGEELARELDLPFLGALPLDPEVVQSGEDGVPVIHRAPDSAAAAAFRNLADELQREVACEAERIGDVPQETRLDDDGTLHIQWSGGHAGRHTAYNLRLACQCAGCVDENSGRRTLERSDVALDVGVENVQPVGRYALAFAFTDGHNTGIYRYPVLREICECTDCQRQRGQGAQEFAV
jgi:ATP-binding protein involved in chromosome partitioning